MDTENPHTDDTAVFDKEAIDRDIAAGAKAFRELLNNASLDWAHWSATILGLRGLRTLAFAKAGTNNMQSQAYRDAMGALLSLRKHSVYDQMEKRDRSACYRLMDRLEDVDIWYSAKVSTAEKLRWRHPETIAKHCPKHLLSGTMRRNNQPKRTNKKPIVSFETERLKALLIQVIKRLAKYEPTALDLLDQVHPADPDDGVDDIFRGDT